ncbi:MAG: endonuclease [Bacteroidia bacterium]|nr:endonuclease [Bacteroidia bacterium]
MKFHYLLVYSLFFVFLTGACKQKPASFASELTPAPYSKYYSKANGKSGAELKTILSEIIGNPNVISYSEIWKAFEKTDLKPNGSIWDMYSDIPDRKSKYTFYANKKRCGNYRQEGDCYNREHSVPRSWFRNAEPMHSDLFHIYPTDGYVNNRRGNLPFGEVGIFSWESSNGSRIGQNTFGNYNQTVFEPIDEYKGDFARTYFYMVTAYEDQVATWRSAQIGGNKYPAINSWALDMFLKWHREDPVSEKEQKRNEAVFLIQNNRNPFIDYPELAEYVWGNKKKQPFNLKKN